MIWEQLVHTDFASIDRATPVVVNIAAIEQHGPHLPLDVDCRIGSHLLSEIPVIVSLNIFSILMAAMYLQACISLFGLVSSMA